MWDMKYKSRGEYITALEAAMEGKDIPEAEKIVMDIKNYFFECNHKSIGDTEVINKLPDPEVLATQYDGKEYSNVRALKKSGSAKFFKRLGIFLLTVCSVVLGVTFFVGFLLMLLFGLLAIASAIIFQTGVTDVLPSNIVSLLEYLPYQLFENSITGTVFLVSLGVFSIVIAITALKALWRFKKKYHTWTLKKISGCYRLPVTLDDVYSKAWRVCVYITIPISLILTLLTAGMMILGVNLSI